uniref:Vacuolar fusion protein CCZ1 homolog n=2 Tax=Schistocephalus solidus TaxID=70667 RepID=A0A0V0J3T2_SCHSO
MVVVTLYTVQEFVVFTDLTQANEADKILYFYPTGKSTNEQLTSAGLCEALVSFSRFFSSPCTAVHMKNGRRFFHELSDHMWAVMTVSPLTPIAVKDCSAYKSCDDSMNDGIMQHALSKLCERFQLLHGPMTMATDEMALAAVKANLATFFQTELATLDLTRCDLIDWFDGICNIYLDADTFANVEKLLQNITYSCNSIKHTALLFDAKLAWSSLPMKEMRLLYRYLVSSIFNVPPDLDLVAISPKAKHMGRFLTGPRDLVGLCAAHLPVPTIFLPGQPETGLQVVAYRALRMTVCLLLDGSRELPVEFFQSFDANFGIPITDLAVKMAFSSSASASDVSMGLASSCGPPRKSSVVTLSRISSSPVTNRAASAARALSPSKADRSLSPSQRGVHSNTSSASVTSAASSIQNVNGAFICWDPDTFAVYSSLHTVHFVGDGGWRALPAAVPLLSLISSLREDTFTWYLPLAYTILKKFTNTCSLCDGI